MGHDTYTAYDIFMCIPIFLIAVIFVILFCSALNLLTLPFSKHIVFLDEKSFVSGDNSVMYTDVTRIELDSGVFKGRFLGIDPCFLKIYSAEELLMSIKHPSLIMSLVLVRRCKAAKFRYTHLKRAIIMWIYVLILCTVLGLIGVMG